MDGHIQLTNHQFASNRQEKKDGRDNHKREVAHPRTVGDDHLDGKPRVKPSLEVKISSTCSMLKPPQRCQLYTEVTCNAFCDRCDKIRTVSGTYKSNCRNHPPLIQGIECDEHCISWSSCCNKRHLSLHEHKDTNRLLDDAPHHRLRRFQEMGFVLIRHSAVDHRRV